MPVRSVLQSSGVGFCCLSLVLYVMMADMLAIVTISNVIVVLCAKKTTETQHPRHSLTLPII